MKQTIVRHLCFALAMLATFHFTIACAQSTAFTYQGRLNDGNLPANGIYDLRFALYDTTNVSGNLLAGPVTNSAASVTNGLFTVPVDFGAGVFAGSNYWLEIAVRTNNGGVFSVLNPRQGITPAPYALYTSKAGFATTAASALSASVANAIGSIANTNVAQLNVPNTAIQAVGTVTVVSGFIVGANVLNSGSGYSTAPLVTVTDASGSNVVITASVTNGAVNNLTVQSAGMSYSTNAIMVIAPPPSDAIQTFGSINNFTGVNTFSGTLNANILYLPVTTATAGVIYSGGSTFVHAFGANNFFAGAGAGNLTVSGNQNVGIGTSALHADTSGSRNAAGGYNALGANTTGSENTATGNGALHANTSGSDNVADGIYALWANLTGYQNTVIGAYAMENNTSGYYNTANGFGALQNNTAGLKNVAMGYVALANNNGSDNTAVGSYTMYGNTSGGDNTAIGQAALNGNSTGNNNTAAGYGALYISTGSQNNAFGVQSLENLQTGAYNLAFGYQAGVNLTNGNNDIYIGNAGTTNESGIIRVGTIGTHGSTIIAGTIYGDGGGLTNLQFTSSGNTIQTSATNSATPSGLGNVIQTGAYLSFVGGGWNNTIGTNAFNSVIVGGSSNTIQQNANNSFVGGGVANSIQANAQYSTVAGGNGNSVTATAATIAGGLQNQARGNLSFVGGGSNNVVNATAAAITGGWGNAIEANATNAVISGGLNNSISGYSFQATIAGGWHNIISGNAFQAVVGGGVGNSAANAYATVPGGALNTASGQFSFAAGYQASASHDGAFVWADSQNALFGSTTTNQFNVRANGGARFVTGGAGMMIDGQPVLSASSTISANQLSGAYTNGITMTNPSNQLNGNFAGNGGGLTNLNASQISSGVIADPQVTTSVARTNQVWLLGGNSGTTAGTNFIGTTDNQPLEFRVNGIRVLRFEANSTGSPNIIGGGPFNSVTNNIWGAIVAGGTQNSINSAWGTVSGGGENTINSEYGTVGGGCNNSAGYVGVGTPFATVAGGQMNVAGGYGATIGGGEHNLAQGTGKFILGDQTVGGGAWNIASGNISTIGGGGNNVANGSGATVGGGYYNIAAGYTSVVAGGNSNSATGDYSFAAGSMAQAGQNGAFVWSDGSTNTVSTTTNQFMARASGGVIFYSGTDTNTGVSLAAGSGSWSSLSDRNSKDEFASINPREVLDKVVAMPMQTWHYRAQASDIRHLGPVAQDFHAAFGLGEDNRHITTIDSEGVALAAIQGLNGKVESESRDTDNQIEELKAENAELKRRLKRLEELVGPAKEHQQ